MTINVKQNRINGEIDSPNVRLISETGEQLGIVSTRSALEMAVTHELDLVEVSGNANPVVCKLMDYGKFVYEQKKKTHESKQKQVTIHIKEIKFRPGTDQHDLDYKIEHARQFLAAGDKVKVAVTFRGREMAHQDIGFAALQKVIATIGEVAYVEVAPKMEGRSLFTILASKSTKKH